MEDGLEEKYRNRLRILLIVFFFSEDLVNPANPELVKLLRSEVKIQKLDFLIRYPSYLCYELLLMLQTDASMNRADVKGTIKIIFESKEPQLRTLEMRRFLYGAWEKLDRTLAFLVAHGLIHFESERNRVGRQYSKEYYLTRFGKEKVELALEELDSLRWYSDRCLLIRRYFGDMSGSELKALQYEHQEYKEALINQYIADIEEQTKQLYFNEFGESL